MKQSHQNGSVALDERCLLPSLPNRLIGRERAVTEIGLLLTTHRIVTITGPGGVGKTSVAIEVARNYAKDFQDGVVFVSLAPVRDARIVVQTIARQAGAPNAGSIHDARGLADTLAGKSLLLVLDNLEQVVDCAADLAEIVALCPTIKCLATSRLVLAIQAEQVFPLPPLSLPPETGIEDPAQILESDAVRLFVERAQAVEPHFGYDESNAAAIAGICARLDGLPLAIELAAARVRILSPPALLTRLERRLPLLTGGPRDAPARQQTLRDALAWSFHLLSARAQDVFCSLAVFVGGFTIEAAEAVARASPEEGGSSAIDDISSLVDNSLVHRLDSGDDPRFIMLETIREYGIEQLTERGKLENAQRSHAEYVAQLVERLRPHIEGPDAKAVLNAFETEHPNIRAALTFALESKDAELGSRMVAVVAPFWMIRNHYREGLKWSESVLALSPEASVELRLEVLYAAADFCTDILDFRGARRLVEEGVSLARAANDSSLESKLLFLLGIVEHGEDKLDDAEKSFARAIELSRGTRARKEIDGQVRALMRLTAAAVAVDQGKLELAGCLVQEADVIFRAAGDTWSLAISTENLATISVLQKDLLPAANGYRRSLTGFCEVGDRAGIANCVTGIAIVAAMIGHFTSSVRLLSAAEAIRARSTALVAPLMNELRAQVQATAKSELGERRFNAAWQAGGALSLEAAIAEASALNLAEPGADEHSFGLTSREIEVLRLMADGRKDREIADALFISYRTATSHVNHILNKLGVESRTAASTEALRLGII